METEITGLCSAPARHAVEQTGNQARPWKKFAKPYDSFGEREKWREDVCVCVCFPKIQSRVKIKAFPLNPDFWNFWVILSCITNPA